MIIGYIRNLDGVLRVAIALLRYPDATLVWGKDKRDLAQKLSQYHGEMVQNVDDIVKSVPFNLKSSLRVKVATCGLMQRQLSPGTYLGYALRHNKCVPDELVKLIARYYPDLSLLLNCDNDMSRYYYHLYREVGAEIERLKAHTRLRPAGEVMYVEIYPEHDIQDLYLNWAMRRNDDRATVIKCNTHYYMVNAKFQGYPVDIAVLSKAEAERIAGSALIADDQVWDTFYDSQFIESRRNKDFAKTKLPAKCAHMSPEIRKERKKVEYGIANITLDDFN